MVRKKTDTPKRVSVVFRAIGYRSGLLFVIHCATSRFALADILCYLDMLWMGGIGVKILPSAEGASKANIVVGVLGVRDVDTYGLVHKNINLVA
jgi:hypothetical protein